MYKGLLSIGLNWFWFDEFESWKFGLSQVISGVCVGGCCVFYEFESWKFGLS